MDHRYAVAALFALALVPVRLPAQTAPDAQGSTPPAVAAHGYAITPVPGEVIRAFDPPLTRYGAGHRGVDLGAAAGEPVVAAMAGTVTFSGSVAGIGWVTVAHGGELDTTYGPLSPRLVAAGTVVAPGELLGLLADGATHLDWGARFGGAYIDPLSLLVRWETYLTTSDADDLPVLGGLDATATAIGGTGGTAAGRTWPAAGPLTSGFGPRLHPVTGQHRLHAGIDIGASTGTPVVAAAAGMVRFAGVAGGYGNTVIVDHGGGQQTLYAHLSAIRVNASQRVGAGQQIGAVGSSGVSTGPHLHFELRHAGTPVDPRTWLPKR